MSRPRTPEARAAKQARRVDRKAREVAARSWAVALGAFMRGDGDPDRDPIGIMSSVNATASVALFEAEVVDRLARSAAGYAPLIGCGSATDLTP